MLLILLFRKKRTAEVVDAAEESVLAGDEIYRQDHADEDIQKNIPDAGQDAHRQIQIVRDVSDHRLGLLLQVRCPVLRIQVDTVLGGKFIEILQFVFNIRRIILRVIHEVGDTADHLREDQPEEKSEHQKDHDDRYND